MITQLIMVSTIFLLIFSGENILQKSKAINYFPGKIFSLGLFLIATGILFYAIRDIFIQFKMYEIQNYFVQYGATLHFIGGLFIFWFLSREFTPKTFIRHFAFLLFLLVMIFFILLSTGEIFTIERELQAAPFEPFPYFVIRNFISVPLGNVYLLAIIVSLAILTSGIMLYNSLKEGNKTLRTKGLFYALGILLLIIPMVICMLVSPIYARIGYLIGAILIYKGLRIKGLTVDNF